MNPENKKFWQPSRKMGSGRLDQCLGALIGQCLGDALGFPVEGLPKEHCENYVRDHLIVSPVQLVGRGKRPFGQYTDDSQLAREMMISFRDCDQKFDPSNYAMRIANMFRYKLIVGRGRATEAAANKLIKGISWEGSGSQAPVAGNGSAMRAAPIGFFCFHNPYDRLILGDERYEEAIDETALFLRAARDQSWITHQDLRCIAGSIAIAGAVRLCFQNNDFEYDLSRVGLQEFLKTLSGWVSSYDSILADALLRLETIVALPINAAFQEISGTGTDKNQPYDRPENWVGITPFVTESILWSLYAFLSSPTDYWQTICTAISGGGDVDTTAAMAGAISGANNGIHVIPIDLVDKLHDRNAWRADDLFDLAKVCYKEIPLMFRMSGLEADYWHRENPENN